jgi:hypothetical protein
MGTTCNALEGNRSDVQLADEAISTGVREDLRTERCEQVGPSPNRLAKAAHGLVLARVLALGHRWWTD